MLMDSTLFPYMCMQSLSHDTKTPLRIFGNCIFVIKNVHKILNVNGFLFVIIATSSATSIKTGQSVQAHAAAWQKGCCFTWYKWSVTKVLTCTCMHNFSHWLSKCTRNSLLKENDEELASTTWCNRETAGLPIRQSSYSFPIWRFSLVTKVKCIFW